jgi:hypothetical protein
MSDFMPKFGAQSYSYWQEILNDLMASSFHTLISQWEWCILHDSIILRNLGGIRLPIQMKWRILGMELFWEAFISTILSLKSSHIFSTCEMKILSSEHQKFSIEYLFDWNMFRVFFPKLSTSCKLKFEAFQDILKLTVLLLFGLKTIIT